MRMNPERFIECIFHLLAVVGPVSRRRDTFYRYPMGSWGESQSKTRIEYLENDHLEAN